MNITELIAERITELLNAQNGSIQIGRNDLANQIGCVPSQINYVITSRFTKEQGYIVESRRGGGGFIKIVRVDYSKSQLILHIINSIGESLEEQTARVLIKSLELDGRLSGEAAILMLSAVSDDNFKGLNDQAKQIIRANLIKSMLIHCV